MSIEVSIEFLVTSLIVIVSPGTGVLYTLAAGLSPSFPFTRIDRTPLSPDEQLALSSSNRILRSVPSRVVDKV